MTEGISKKELKDKLSTLYWSTDDCNQLITAMMCECEELDPWLPIENAPLNSRLRLFTKHDRRQVDATLYFDDDKETFTHYKLLPEDPK